MENYNSNIIIQEISFFLLIISILSLTVPHERYVILWFWVFCTHTTHHNFLHVIVNLSTDLYCASDIFSRPSFDAN